MIRQQIRNEVISISPFDDLETATQRDVLAWIDSGVELCRLEKPATPPKHLVSYIVLVDGDYLLMVDHIKAELWAPPGGHVEPGEHPQETAHRELQEELGVAKQLLFPHPFFLSQTITVGKTPGHFDISLWYIFKGDRTGQLKFDPREFHGIRWFHKKEVPLNRSDPQMGRFLNKLYNT